MTVRVLIIDDAAELRRMLSAIIDLHDQGWTVVGSAQDGADGVECARTTQPDLVLLDLAMPVLDGLEALPLIRDAAPQSAIVILTGFPSAAARAVAMHQGADGFMEKKDLVTTLIPQLEHLLDEPKAAWHHAESTVPVGTTASRNPRR